MEELELEIEPVFLPYLVVCGSDPTVCANAGVPILVDMPEGSALICGPCGQTITDISGPITKDSEDETDGQEDV